MASRAGWNASKDQLKRRSSSSILSHYRRGSEDGDSSREDGSKGSPLRSETTREDGAEERPAEAGLAEAASAEVTSEALAEANSACEGEGGSSEATAADECASSEEAGKEGTPRLGSSSTAPDEAEQVESDTPLDAEAGAVADKGDKEEAEEGSTESSKGEEAAADGERDSSASEEASAGSETAPLLHIDSGANWTKPGVPPEILMAMVQDAGALPSPGTVSHPMPKQQASEDSTKGSKIEASEDASCDSESGDRAVPLKQSPIFAMARPNKGEIKRQPILRPYTAAEDQKVLEGWCWLTKINGSNIPLRSNKTPEWKRRYCLLERGTVYYHKLKLRDSYTLHEPEVDYEQLAPQSLTGTRLGYVFTLTFTTNNKKSVTIRFAAGSVPELEEWKAAFLAKAPVETESQSSGEDVRRSAKHKHGLLMMHDGGKWRLRDLTIHYGHSPSSSASEESKPVVLEIATRERQCVFPLLRSFADKSELKFKQPHKGATEQNVISIASDKEVLLLSPEGAESVTQHWLTHIDREIMLLHDVEDEADSESEGKKLKQPSLQSLQHGNDIHDLIRNGKLAREKLRQTWKEADTPIPQVLDGEKKPFFIIAIDGGGLKGVLDCVLLQRLEERYPDLLDNVDMFAGTSNGAIISTGFAFGLSPSTARSLMEMKGPIIFTNPVSKIKSMSQPKFDNKWLKLVLKETYSGQRLKDAKRCAISAFELDDEAPEEARSWCPRTYHNLGGDGDCSDVLASDLVMRSTAAPTYFSTYQNHVDGALFDQDPSSSALVLAMSPKRLNLSLDRIVLLSLGTGHVPRYIEGDSHDWGVAQWLPKVTGLLWDGMVMKSGNFCSELLGDRYMRIDPIMQEEIPLDDPKMIPETVRVAESVDLEAAYEWIGKHLYRE